MGGLEQSLRFQLLELIFSDKGLMNTSFSREGTNRKQEEAVVDPNDDDFDEDNDEEDLRKAIMRMLGALLASVDESSISAILPQLQATKQQWLQYRKDFVTVLSLSCEVASNLKPNCIQHAVPFLMEDWQLAFQVLQNPTSQDAQLGAVYLINVSAPIPQFSNNADAAFQLLQTVLGRKKAKKRDVKARLVFDNSV